MSSIWSSSVAQQGSPFAANSAAPTPGGGAVARFQSILGSASPSAASPSLASPGAASAAISPADSSSSSSDSGATITANDFLTLLVTEMQNQDPTADTDPNAYIDQLVQINSLEQLISINQNLSDVLGAAGSTTTTSNAVPSGRGIAHAQAGNQPTGQSASQALKQVGSSVIHGQPATASSTRAPVQGNLSVPPQSAASRAASHALDGHRNPARQGHAIRDIPTRPLP